MDETEALLDALVTLRRDCYSYLLDLLDEKFYCVGDFKEGDLDEAHEFFISMTLAVEQFREFVNRIESRRE